MGVGAKSIKTLTLAICLGDGYIQITDVPCAVVCKLIVRG